MDVRRGHGIGEGRTGKRALIVSLIGASLLHAIVGAQQGGLNTPVLPGLPSDPTDPDARLARATCSNSGRSNQTSSRRPAIICTCSRSSMTTERCTCQTMRGQSGTLRKPLQEHVRSRLGHG